MKHAAPLVLVALTACGGRSGDLSEVLSPDSPLARGVGITKLEINQGVSHVLRDSRFGKPFGQPAVVQDRDGLMRVHLDVDDDWEPREVLAVLDFDGVRGPARYIHSLYVEGDSAPYDTETTFDIDIPARLVHEGSFFTVTLHESDPFATPPDVDENPEALFDLREDPWTVVETGPVNLRIVPIRYEADGSGRTPDVSPARIAELARGMKALYPVTDVVVEVVEPISWSSSIQPNGGGWTTLLANISLMRESESDLPPNTYFYGLFEAAESEQQFCAQGCVLGLSNVGTLTDTWSRASIGLGHPGQLTIDTMLHEVGHAHGREHAPCGQGVSSIDPGFPHSGGSLGTVGWDINTGELIDPNEYKDLMGYCSPIWVSDYTWHHLSERTAALNQPVEMERSAPGLRWQHYAVELDGSVVTVGEPMERERVPRGQLIDVKLVDARGTRTVEAHWFPSDHLDTGSLILPTDARFGPDTQVVLD